MRKDFLVLVVISTLAIVGVLAWSFWPSASLAPLVRGVSCSAGDPNYDINTKGSVTMSFANLMPQTFSDSCTNKDRSVIQPICNINPRLKQPAYVTYRTTACPKGYKCSDGACVVGGYVGWLGVSCEDSDPGNDVAVKGHVVVTEKTSSGETRTTNQQSDRCIAGFKSYVYQSNCVQQGAYFTRTETKTRCPTGASCSDGVCVKPSYKL